MRLKFVLQGEPLGNGYAASDAREHLDGSPVLIVFGDAIIKGDMKGLIQSSKSLPGVKKVEDLRRLGVVDLDVNGNITRFA